MGNEIYESRFLPGFDVPWAQLLEVADERARAEEE